jgi:hypothetical protein
MPSGAGRALVNSCGVHLRGEPRVAQLVQSCPVAPSLGRVSPVCRILNTLTRLNLSNSYKPRGFYFFRGAKQSDITSGTDS